MALDAKTAAYSPEPGAAPRPPSGSEEILALALAISAGLKDLRRAQAQLLGLRPAAYALLEVLAQGPEAGMLVSEAAASLGIRPQALSGLAAELAEQGWLMREVDAADGRARRLALTPQGRENLAPAQELKRGLSVQLGQLMPNTTLAKLAFGKFLEALGVTLRNTSAG